MKVSRKLDTMNRPPLYTYIAYREISRELREGGGKREGAF